MLIKVDIQNYIESNISNSISAKLVCIDNNFTLQAKIFIGSNDIKEFIKWILNNKSIVIK